MFASEGTMGRVFVLRLEDGERIPDVIEDFAAKQGLQRAVVLALGGADATSRLVCGPEDGAASAITPMVRALGGVHEMAAVGTLFPNEAGRPCLHMHGSFGRDDSARTGCVRQGVEVWKLAEVVLLELTGLDLLRRVDPAFGFEVLAPGSHT